MKILVNRVKGLIVAYVICARICVLFLGLIPTLGLAGELLDHLKQYEGRWVGEFTVKSDVSDYSETFAVEQQYWMNGSKLFGVTVYERPKGGLESAESIVTINQDGSLLMKVRRGNEVEAYVGVYREGGIIWLPSDMKRAEDYQTTVRIAEVEGGLEMTTEGFDTYVHSGGVGHVLFLGRLNCVAK